MSSGGFTGRPILICFVGHKIVKNRLQNSALCRTMGKPV
jgi:hypothetical protein